MVNGKKDRHRINPTSVRMPPELKEKASAEARRREWSLNTYINKAIADRVSRDSVMEVTL